MRTFCGRLPLAESKAQAIFDNFAQKTGKSPEIWASGLIFCGAEGIRTPDLLSAIQALSQLSYSPMIASGRPSI